MVYCFTGYPLSGKSTLAKQLAMRLRVEYFSTGDYARSLGMGLESSIKERDLSEKFDVEISNAAMGAVVQNKVVDGFPRSVSQIGQLVSSDVEFVVIFVIENPIEIFDRMAERAVRQNRPEDALDVVVGRLRRSMQFKHELESVLLPGQFLVFRGSDGINALIKELGI